MKTCDKCGAVFRNDSLLKDHEENDHEKNIEIEIDDEIPKEVSTTQQLHCALTDSPDCQFQCETKEQSQRHIETEHRAKTNLQCTVCNIVFRNLENLSIHMNSTCQEKFKTKSDLDIHIIAEHKSYKPCRNFATDSCEYTKCRYNHTVLKKGEHLCYKCGDIFNKKSVLLNHIKNIHNDLCLKYLEGICTYGSRCVYIHTETIAQDVVTNSKDI